MQHNSNKCVFVSILLGRIIIPQMPLGTDQAQAAIEKPTPRKRVMSEVFLVKKKKCLIISVSVFPL